MWTYCIWTALNNTSFLTGLDIPENERSDLSKRLFEEFQCTPVYISDEVADRHYNGFSNSILWPLFHYRKSAFPVARI